MPTTDVPADWAARIERERETKAEYFRESPRSPLPQELRGADFPGLAYFDPDPAYRFSRPLEEHDRKERITVETTADGEQTYRRWGAFRFEIDGTEYTLQAYRPDSDAERFWVPFRDETNGEETYEAGRYLDLVPDEHLVDGEWELDFNAAYNPTCAYNHAYECPLIPVENWLDVRIEAGEQDFPADPHGHQH
ncbi:DUF1684 domain-containing protein [Halomicroarcula sp. GCM10025817]|uniref:DUF1684 domain-containing protein n=1 Tax=Haloarcula TaxID=2237 RepID=UPI0023E7ED98|nr:DUF1684 domain-containing protein [Halomicroarcula sp. SYNS111]